MSNLDYAQDLSPALSRRWVSPQPIPLSDMALVFFQDSNGSRDMNVDGSAVPVMFKATCPPGNQRCIVATMSIAMWDNKEFKPNRFGGINGGLTNGVVIGIYDVDDTLLYGGITAFKRNIDMFALAGSSGVTIISGRGPDPDAVDHVCLWGWPIHEFGFSPILEPGQYFSILVQDDLTNLSYFQGRIRGRYVRP